MTCWFDDFIAWLKTKNEKFPVPDGRFNDLVVIFAAEDAKGIAHKLATFIGFIDGKLVFMRYSVLSIGKIFDTFAVLDPIKKKWD